MDTLSSSAKSVEASRKILSLALQGIARMGLTRIGEEMGVDASTVHRWKEKDLPRLAQLLALIGLKVVPNGYRCVDADTYKTMKRLAIERLQEEDDSPRLEFE